MSTHTATITTRPVVGLTGVTEHFWMVMRNQRLIASGIAATEADARTAAEAV